MIRIHLPHPDAAELDMWLCLALAKKKLGNAVFFETTWED
jgi:hypothetical protein